MNARRVEVTFDEKTWERFEAVRGREPRAAFVRRAVQEALVPGETTDKSLAEEAGTCSRAQAEAAEFKPTNDPPTFSKPTTVPKPQHVPSVMSGRDVLNAQRQERMNEQRKS